MAKPFLKWAGGKTQLLPEILARMPSRITKYNEPFLGGGSVFLALAAAGRFLPGAKITLSDSNEELIWAWRAVRDYPDTVISGLQNLKVSEDDYYQMRASSPDLPIDRAIRLIYLNKTTYNGLYRVNSKGEFNAPWGKKDNFSFADTCSRIRDVSRVLNDLRVSVSWEGYKSTFAAPFDYGVIYSDPPYLPVKNGSFVEYTNKGFSLGDHQELSHWADRIRKQGVYGLFSNSDCPEIVEMYLSAGLHIDIVKAPRMINRNPDGRGDVFEILARTHQEIPDEI